MLSHQSPIAPTSDNARARRGTVLGVVVGGCLAYGALVAPEGVVSNGFVAVGATVFVVLAATWIKGRMRARLARGRLRLLLDVLDKDATPSILTDAAGVITSRNAAAETRFGAACAATLADTLRATLADPSETVTRISNRARLAGVAQEELGTRAGALRVTAHQIRDQGYLWRFEPEPAPRHPVPDTATVPVPMITAGPDGSIVFMNDAARELVGRRARSLERLFATLPVRAGAVHAISTETGEQNVLVAERTGAAGRRDLFLLPSEQDDGSADGLVFETLPVPLMKVAPDGSILLANRLAGALLGQSPQPGTMLTDVMQGLGRPVLDWLNDTLNGRSVHQSEFLRLTRDDKEVFVQVTLSRVTDDGQTALIAVLNDATELKTLEAQFVQSQKMQAIGQLAGGVAHDFNNLLTAISGHCDLLLLRHDQGDPDYGDLVQINQNANRAAALVGQLLAFSRKQTLRPEVLDLRDTLSDLTHLLNRLVGEKVTLTLSHDPILQPIRADKRQLEQVLMNLVVNARDAMPSGGEIRIVTEVITLAEPVERDRARIPEGDYVTVKVQDDGVGIAPDKLQKVFEPFYTTKRTGEGTGLGLSTAYGIIKQSGGFIFVDSAPESGACFTLYFPVHDAAPTPEIATTRQSVSATPKHGEGVVLLVEDEAPVRAFASRALRLRGYTVLEAESAEDALRTLDDPDLTVDVFVTDVVMPGMDGPSWVRKALETRPDVRVVFVSGYAEGAFGDDGPTVPNSVFLPKPFSLNQLTDTVHQQLH